MIVSSSKSIRHTPCAVLCGSREYIDLTDGTRRVPDTGITGPYTLHATARIWQRDTPRLYLADASTR
jgi:hypothetical protein